jgi:hypothetical protein
MPGEQAEWMSQDDEAAAQNTDLDAMLQQDEQAALAPEFDPDMSSPHASWSAQPVATTPQQPSQPSPEVC